MALGKRVFAVGGPGIFSSSVEEFNYNLGTWSMSTWSLLQGRKNVGVISIPAVWFKHFPAGCVGVQ